MSLEGRSSRRSVRIDLFNSFGMNFLSFVTLWPLSTLIFSALSEPIIKHLSVQASAFMVFEEEELQNSQGSHLEKVEGFQGKRVHSKLIDLWTTRNGGTSSLLGTRFSVSIFDSLAYTIQDDVKRTRYIMASVLIGAISHQLCLVADDSIQVAVASISDLKARVGFVEPIQALCLSDHFQALVLRQVCREYQNGVC
jgi:hypothetical protein